MSTAAAKPHSLESTTVVEEPDPCPPGDPRQAAREAGLRYVVDAEPGIRRERHVGRAVTAEPALLYRRGFLHEQMRRDWVVKNEVVAAIRGNGVTRLDEVEAVVLETDGTCSALTRAESGRRTSANLPGSG